MGDTLVLSSEKNVIRKENTVLRPVEPWSGNIRLFLEHLFGKGLPVPRFFGVNEDGQEILEFIEGDRVHPGKWSDAALIEVGRLVASLHRAALDFTMPRNGLWKPWCLRETGYGEKICCHGDIAPWNMLTKNAMPAALIDWEMAGPLDPVIELARVCWLFPQLFDDDLKAIHDLPSAEKRAAQVRMICDAYGLPPGQRSVFLEKILEAVICETAHEAIDTNITYETEGSLWGIAWRTRSLYWIWRNRDTIQQALV